MADLDEDVGTRIDSRALQGRLWALEMELSERLQRPNPSHVSRSITAKLTMEVEAARTALALRE